MKQRVLIGLLLAVLLIPLTFLPNTLFIIAVGVLSLLAVKELYSMLHFDSPLPIRALIMMVILHSMLYLGLVGFFTEWFAPIVLGLMMIIWLIIMLVMMVFIPQLDSQKAGKITLFTLYTGVTFSALALLKTLGIEVLFFLLILAMVTDMFAYFVGVRFGKTKLAPTISPKKTVEGAIGGTVIAVILASLFGFWFSVLPIEQNVLGFILYFVVGIFVSLAAQIGDLIASKFKRDHGIKDFSKLIPGHGGVLDRFDSSLFAGAMLYFLLRLIEVL